MTQASDNELGRVVSYVVDQDDRLVNVGNGWTTFASENEGADDLHPDSVIGQSLWEYIRSDALQQLYRSVMHRVRNTQQRIEYPYRCDSPRFIRRMHMEVTPLDSNHIGFRSETVAVTPRNLPQVVQSFAPATSALKRCSICNLFELRTGEWTEGADAVIEDAVFDLEGRIQIVWSLCEACRSDFATMLDSGTVRGEEGN